MNLDLPGRFVPDEADSPLGALSWTDDETGDCRCEPSFREPAGTGVDDRVVLAVDADDCPGRGDLAASPDCLATVVEALTDRDADVVRTRHGGRERAYAGRAAACLTAAGQFRDRVAFHEERLAERVARDPVAAATEAADRAEPIDRIARETGLLAAVAADDDECARDEETDREPELSDVVRAHVGPTVAAARVAATPPPGATLVDRWTVSTGAVVRIYEGDGPLRTYHLTPPSAALDADAAATLADACDHLLDDPRGGDRAPGRAIRAVADDGEPVGGLTDVLRRHTRGYGTFEHVFADDAVSDATVTAPVADNPLRVVVDGERHRTNVRLPPEGPPPSRRGSGGRAGVHSRGRPPRLTRRSKPSPAASGSPRRRRRRATGSRSRSGAATRRRGRLLGSCRPGRSPRARPGSCPSPSSAALPG